MNVYDSERMVEAMQTAGYEQTEDVNDADMILLNTCHIREKAESLFELGDLIAQAGKPDLKVAARCRAG